MVRRRAPGDWDPFDGWPFSLDPSEMMEEMRREMREMMMDMDRDFMSSSRGYRMTVGPEGDRRIEIYGDVPDPLLPDAAPERGAPAAGTAADDDPPPEVLDCEGTYIITMEMPGVSDEDIAITVEGDRLRVTASRDERMYDRTVQLPGPAVGDSITRTYVNGILEVTLDRAEECPGDKHI